MADHLPPAGLVLDPFTGSGPTGKASMLEGRTFIGCELTKSYLPIATGRIADAERRAAEAAAIAKRQGSLFEAAA